MIVGRVLGWVLLAIALVLLGRDIIAMIDAGGFVIAPLGEIWYAVDRASLNGLQAGIERYLSVWLWDSVVAPVLQWPAVPVFLVPGAVLSFLCRKRHNHRHFS